MDLVGDDLVQGLPRDPIGLQKDTRRFGGFPIEPPFDADAPSLARTP